MESSSLATSPLFAASPKSFYEQIRDNTAYSVDFNHCDDSSSDIWSDDPTPNRQYEFQLINQLADSKYPLKTPSPTEPQDYHPDYSNDCMIHQEDGGKLYCETCTCIICGECSIGHHDDHTTLSLADAVNDAEAKANRVLKELNMTIDVLTKKLTTLQEDVLELNNYYLQSLDFLSTSLIKDTALDRSLAKKYLDETLNSRSKSFPAIEAKQEDLKTAIARLTGNARSITEAIEASKYVPNPLGVVITKDMAAAELFQLQHHIQKSLPAVNSLPSSGTEEIRPLSIWSPQAGKQIPPQQTGCISPKFPVTRPTVGPMGRPIALNPFPVKVKCPINSRTAMPTKFTVIGNDGTNKSLCRPWGVACDKDGNILIADRSNHRILIYKEDGTFLREFGSRGSELGQFNLPAGITVDARRRIVVVDKDNHRVQMFTMNGKFLLSFGERGSQCGQFKYPWDVATNNDCQIAVTDTLNHRIQLFSPEGVFLRKFGYETNPRMLWVLDSPRGIAFNPRGDIVTTDFNNHRLVVIDYDFTYADIFECNTGGGETPFLRPQGVVVDDAGNIIVADCRNNRVVVLDPSGQLKWTFDCFHHGKETMDRPSGIAITRTGQIVVVDFGHDRALLF